MGKVRCRYLKRCPLLPAACTPRLWERTSCRKFKAGRYSQREEGLQVRIEAQGYLRIKIRNEVHSYAGYAKRYDTIGRLFGNNP